MSAITGKLRGRDVERRLLLIGDIHPELRKVLYDLAEQSYNNSMMLAEAIGLMNKSLGVVNSFNTIAGNMKSKIDAFERNATDPAPDLDNKQ